MYVQRDKYIQYDIVNSVNSVHSVYIVNIVNIAKILTCEIFPVLQ